MLPTGLMEINYPNIAMGQAAIMGLLCCILCTRMRFYTESPSLQYSLYGRQMFYSIFVQLIGIMINGK